MSSLLEGLNPEQRDVVMHDKGALLVVAVAGAGKTTALTKRIAYLVSQRDIPAGSILAVTFSAKAATEMNERLEALVPDAGARVGTFHSLAMQIARQEGIHAGYTLDDSDKYRYVVKDALGFRGMKWDSADLSLVMSYITLCKANCALPGTAEAVAVAQRMYDECPAAQRTPSLLSTAYATAEALRHERRMITFDDLLLDVWKLFTLDPEAAARWSAKWDYILQDEAQDENRVQREIVEALARRHSNYMVVGDLAQGIYAFRGSSSQGMTEFEAKWNAKVIRMERNYRCGDGIVAASNHILDHMSAAVDLGARIKAERGIPGTVSVKSETTSDEEASNIAAEIAGEVAAGDAQWGDYAILVRVNSQTRSLEEQLLVNRVPYIVLGGTNFYERREVKDLLAYLRIAADRGTFDDVRRCINAPFRFLGKAFVDTLESFSPNRGVKMSASQWVDAVRRTLDEAHLQQRQRNGVESWCGLIASVANRIGSDAVLDDAIDTEATFSNRPHRLLDDIIDDTGYVRWITREEGAESTENNRVTNIRELVRAAERFGSVDSLLDYIDETVAAAKRQGRDSVGDRVVVMSIHKSKGLEFPRVYVIGAAEKILPHGRATDIDEERRLAYVAFTRSRDVLRVSYPTQGAFGAMQPSRFLTEARLIGATQ